MQSVDLFNIEKLSKDLSALFDEIPNKRREMHEQIAVLIKDEVDIQIANSGLNDSSGRVKEWQKSYVGSKGGYAAVRASDKTTGDNSPGAITNYLENGHKIRKPSGKSKKYRPRIRTPYVDGYHFYQSARSSIESKAIAVAEKYAEEIAKKMEG